MWKELPNNLTFADITFPPTPGLVLFLVAFGFNYVLNQTQISKIRNWSLSWFLVCLQSLLMNVGKYWITQIHSLAPSSYYPIYMSKYWCFLATNQLPPEIMSGSWGGKCKNSGERLKKNLDNANTQDQDSSSIKFGDVLLCAWLKPTLWIALAGNKIILLGLLSFVAANYSKTSGLDFGLWIISFRLFTIL